MKNIGIFISITALSYTSCKAQPGLRTKEVFMYKNGYSYIHKSGTVNLSNGSYRIMDKDVPQSLFGSIWLQSPQKVLRVQRYSDTIDKKVYQPSVEQMLRKSKGESVVLHIFTPTGLEKISGTVSHVFEVPKGETDLYNVNPAIAIIETSGGSITVYRETLTKVLYATFGSAGTMVVTERTIQPGLMVEFNTDKSSAELDMIYLERHLSWAPAYRLKLNDNKGTLSLSAEVSAGNLDLDKVKLNLVAGMPEVANGGILSRLAGIQEYDYYEAAPAYREDAVENRAYDRSKDVAVESGNAEDYYVYSIKDFSLQKNQSALVNILQEEINVDHIFSCDLYGVNEYTQPGGSSEPQLVPVFHVLEFLNPVKQPLTAAPIFVETSYSGGGELLLGQPNMNSVPVGGKARITVAESLDVPVTQTEEETKRVSNAHTYKYGSTQVYFDLVAVSAAIHIENQGNKEKTIKITRNIQGKPLTSDVTWALKTLPPVISSPNSNTEISWTIKLKPGEKKDIKYSYEYFLRLY